MGFSHVVIFLAACALDNGLTVPTAPAKDTYGAPPTGPATGSFGVPPTEPAKDAYSSPPTGPAKNTYSALPTGPAKETYGAAPTGPAKETYGAAPTGPAKETYGARPAYAQALPAAIPQVKPAPSQRTYGEPAAAPAPQRYGGGRPAYTPSAAVHESIPTYGASPSVVTTTVTVFGPVAIETVTNTVIATKMIIDETTTDIRLSEYTTLPYDALATSTFRIFSQRQPETTTSYVTATYGAPGGVLTSTDYETKRKTVTLTSTRFDTITRSSFSTVTIEHFSTAIDIEIVANYMTTTISETSTLITVGVRRVTTTFIVPDQYY